ncbi:methylenetetrahydrofolate--tRNA-(uracil(54)-C(5))-methyltransferase (FADH(2)-oxidizing) TrmFO [Reyranella sp.]|jgi:methylenetetrahydrofolate--tRNA-(uracil-5-)-methyltransferase|uniref:methylenetetrahydrofolate--tRNA-(uracil(54)- C(5))-methyltransferase (FADH(2)-oxidizing) TrmFO n=1 Tax=Reyranella sp. TaxID=1929291 RepID=UPI000BD53DAE|nr:methylenetetrahydrofolate--tRNA-(uracil(54)-C(5))-methyltransferase (FADH(2)-oxidizing) TrmFO [Reyranella sp.]OYY37608.1 MAG: methylenetetrahydrofolate--tRNA-(uracil(54)-C(5))-methyltransferase (FADH(2)-oxidizing) TrmFO [Rhodospirillales bacterium 35-66-84]OYZ92653.1 MAG: methylenetetrahydrofolate--tRNA-(uracil(54)-C(5))-methyltransferase (FADH(2)-oxidizing) TrmFO [Rhodospirillales bacterium 24-66-33]OZB24015.1 MAG: methylenetetrahydrofolate--tRNA-(uracil(54)-C(5))-methyltransferase (FADH(2)-
MTSSTKPVHIVGGGLAGSEAAWQLAQAGVPVVLHEMRPLRGTEAHLTDSLAELVCSNSFRSDDAANNAVGVIHEEMRRAGSLIMRSADAHKLPAGGALAVDRHGFSAAVQETLLAHPLVTLEREEVAGLPPDEWDSVIVATGPLTSPALADAIAKLTGEDSLAFFDAIAPIVHHESIDQSIAWKQSRYDKVGPGNVEGSDGADYFNCPMDKPQYEAFVAALLAGEKTEFKHWEHNTPYFQGCQPIEVIASTGPQSLRFGPMKPVGLRDPRTGHRPWAVVQLRQDNALGTLWNIVGFQTKLKHGEQTRIFRTIPGLEKAEFARLGGLHRNTFLNSPRLLDGTLRLKAMPRLRFAGQITGCEGYVESAAVGLMTGRFAAAERLGRMQVPPPSTTAMGALLGHITGGADATTFQPMNINFGLFPPIAGNFKGKERKQAMAVRALRDFDDWLKPAPLAAE